MGFVDLHTHTCYCDGKSTPREMVEAAIKKGVETLGILSHSYVVFDPEASVKHNEEQRFVDEIHSLAEEFSGKIKLLAGTERDIYTTAVGAKYDYVIGAVHYFRFGDKYQPIDIDRSDLIKTVELHFGGDFYAMAEDYYEKVATLPDTVGADIIAHIDLITKFNEGDCLFDTRHPRYVAAYRRAIDLLIPSGVIFEINTGAISRGYRREPYPAADIYGYIKERGGKFILSSDAHKSENIAFLFEKYRDFI